MSTPSRYIEAVGRRKTSVARVRITPEKEISFEVNGKPLAEYFPVLELQNEVMAAVQSSSASYRVTVKVAGGGISSQAGAIKLGIARALVKGDTELRKPLKAKGMLKRDPRAKERRKFGLKKARKAPQWSKR